MNPRDTGFHSSPAGSSAPSHECSYVIKKGKHNRLRTILAHFQEMKENLLRLNHWDKNCQRGSVCLLTLMAPQRTCCFEAATPENLSGIFCPYEAVSAADDGKRKYVRKYMRVI